MAGGGGVIRDSRCCLKLGYFDYFGHQTSLEAETQALLCGLKHAASLHCTYLWIELDSLLLVNMLTKNYSIPWNIWYYISSIKRLLQGFVFFITHIYREGNKLADGLANVAVDTQESS